MLPARRCWRLRKRTIEHRKLRVIITGTAANRVAVRLSHIPFVPLKQRRQELFHRKVANLIYRELSESEAVRS